MEIDKLGGDGDGFALGISERGEMSAVDASGVDVDSVVEPERPGYRGVAKDYKRVAVISGGPVGSDGEAGVVGLAGGFSIDGKRAGVARGDSLERLRKAGVSNDQIAVVEDEVAGQAGKELCRGGAEWRWFGGELVECAGKAGRGRDGLGVESGDHSHVLIAGDAERMARMHHGHDEAEYGGGCGPATYEVADKCQGSAGRRGYGEIRCMAIDLVAEGSQERE